MTKHKIVFFGSGPVAASSLEQLLKNFEIVGVVTKPKPPHHKGSFPVIDVAERNDLPLYLVSNRSELSELLQDKPFSTEVAILIDFGIIVSRDVIDYFPKGIINSHFSLLPQWRGADPITFSILSGQDKTGVSLMLLDEGMDTGKIIRQKSIDISDNDTGQTLTTKLINLSSQMLASDVALYLSGELKPRSQPHPNRATYSRKLSKTDGLIDWSKPAEVIEREIRAFKDWPKSFTRLADIDVIISTASVSNDSGKLAPAKVYSDKKHMLIGTATSPLNITSIQLPGKKEMPIEAFLAGYKNRLPSN